MSTRMVITTCCRSAQPPCEGGTPWIHPWGGGLACPLAYSQYIDYTKGMKQILTVSCKLQVTPQQAAKLDATLEAFALACTYTHEAIPPHITNRVRMQAMVYYELRAQFGLSANLTQQAVRRVSANRKAAKTLGSEVKTFASTSVEYDARVFSFRERDWTVSLTVLGGRERFPLAIGNYQRGVLAGQRPKSATLVKRRDGTYYVQMHLTSEAPEPSVTERIIGIDLGRRDIAHTSEGHAFSGEAITRVRDHFAIQRTSIQTKASKGTRSTRRRGRQLLQRLSGREQRFQRWWSHTIAFRLVRHALMQGAS